MSIDIIARALAAKASQVTGTTSGVDMPTEEGRKIAFGII